MDASGGYTPQNLSPRQRDVLKLIVRGLSNKEIARSLNLAEGTVKSHVAALFGKLGVHRRAAVAIAGGVISLPAGTRHSANTVQASHHRTLGRRRRTANEN